MLLIHPYYAETIARQQREASERDARSYASRHPEVPRAHRSSSWHLPHFRLLPGRNRRGLHAAST